MLKYNNRLSVFMNKKGVEMATGTIVMVLIGLIVLAIIVVIFRQQATKGSEGYQEYRQQTGVGSLSNCNNIILGRKCVDAGSCPEGSRRASGIFEDCQSPKACCEPS